MLCLVTTISFPLSGDPALHNMHNSCLTYIQDQGSEYEASAFN